MFYILLLTYSFFAIKLRKNLLVLMLLSLQIISVASAIVIDLDDYSSNPNSFLSVIAILFCTFVVILPWNRYKNLTQIVCDNEKALDQLTRILLIISGFSFIVLLTTSIVVNLFIIDINEFKYSEGEAMRFYYTMLPFDVRFFIVAVALYNLAYFLVPLHFYYLIKGNYKRAIWCAVFSLNLVLYGLSFFSRWAIAEFFLYYLAIWVMVGGMITKKVNNKLKKWVLLFIMIGGFIFIAITSNRFGESTIYDNVISVNSLIQNPDLYTFFDYLSQSNSNSLYYLNSYNGRTFGGTMLVSTIQDFFSGFGIVSPPRFAEIRQQVWGNSYEGGFCGWTTYLIYDVGIIGALIVSFIYYRMVLINARRRSFSINNLFVCAILLQIPLCAIFYSVINRVLFCLIIYVFVNFFLKTKYT